MERDKKDFEKDGLENEEIIKIVREIREKIEVNLTIDISEKLQTEYQFFAERYPILFDIATRTSEAFNWEYLNYFLSMRAKIINDELTSDKASVIIGQEWFNKHTNVKEPLEPPIRFTRKNKENNLNKKRKV
jgi:hypothetical protein